MSQYRPQDFESKWQKFWDEKKVYHAPNPGEPGFDPKKTNYYVLDMFPYPSGSGLHVGHASGYIGTDIVARRKRMEGFNVLHPMGWDAFGLPAEQYAIQTGQHPAVTTEKNADNFRRQLKLLALSYDWDREVNTSYPDYYKWTQWLFLKLYEKGLAYEKEVSVWWCEDLKTVLANEEVIGGRSERGNHPCERRPLKQWVLKITAYADRLIEDLNGLDWPESIKKMQVDWIGRSEGAEIDFPVKGRKEVIRVFSTRPDTIFGVNAVVLAPDHPWALALTTDKEKAKVEAYRAKAMSKSDRERKAEATQITGVFTGAYCSHPLLADRQVPIYLADYVLVEYGTGAVMSVPAHDDRDFRFAVGEKLEILPVISPNGTPSPAEVPIEGCFSGEGTLINSDAYTGLDSKKAREKITDELERRKLGARKITYKLKDWVFSRQRYWGEPFPLSFAPDGTVVPTDVSELPVVLPEMKDFTPSADGAAPLAREPAWVNHTSKTGVPLKRVTDTMPGWAGSCWYFLRFMDPKNDKAAFGKEAVEYWKQVDLYVGGTSHAVMHLLYARFWHKVFYDWKLVPTSEPFKKLFNQGMVTAFAFKDSTGRLVPSDDVEAVGMAWRSKSTQQPVERLVTKMAKSLRNVVNPDDVIAKYGCDVLRLFEMFLGPLDDDKPWTDEGISGCERFLRRAWSLFTDDNDNIKPSLLATATPPPQDEAYDAFSRAWARCLKRVDDSFNALNFNTAVAGFMEFLNSVSETPTAFGRKEAEAFLRALSPFCPHIAAELWQRMGHDRLVDQEAWPTVDPRYLVEDTYELVMSINGRPRKRANIKKGTSNAELEKLALETLKDGIAGKPVVKVIVVPDKLVNVVIKG